jgi:hypothetical protein
MGGVFVKSYFPDGFEAWLNETVNKKNASDEDIMDFVRLQRAVVHDIIKTCKEHAEQIKEQGAEAWIKEALVQHHKFDQWRDMRERNGVPMVPPETENDEDTQKCYEEMEKEVAAMPDPKIEDVPDPNIGQRMIYDAITSAAVADIWLRMVNMESLDEIRALHKKEFNGRLIEDTMWKGYKEYGVPFSPQNVIAAYKHMCC